MDTAGSGNARCPPRRSSLCRHPPPSSPQRALRGPDVGRSELGLSRQDGRGSAARSPSSFPHVPILDSTLAWLTTAASSRLLHPALWTLQGLALLPVALHVTPLKTDAIGLRGFLRNSGVSGLIFQGTSLSMVGGLSHLSLPPKTPTYSSGESLKPSAQCITPNPFHSHGCHSSMTPLPGWRS